MSKNSLSVHSFLEDIFKGFLMRATYCIINLGEDLELGLDCWASNGLGLQQVNGIARIIQLRDDTEAPATVETIIQ